MGYSIKSIEEIMAEFHKEMAQITDISVSINFPFSENYKEIVTKIKTVSISTKCKLYSFAEAKEITEKYSGTNNTIKDFWFIGKRGFDYWVMDKKGKIHFWEIPEDKTIDVNINFLQWLQFAYLDKENDIVEKQLESIDEAAYLQGEYIEYIAKINEISKELKEFIYELY